MNVSYQSDSDALILKMDHCRAYYKTLSQRVYVVEPDDMPPRATILLVHGICEHPFRYFPVAVEWAREGYQTLLFDLYGHGLESEEIEPFLWLTKAYLETTDARECRDIIKSESPESSELAKRIRKTHLKRMKKVRMRDHLNQISSIVNDLSSSETDSKSPPFFLAGHSMGGLLAAEAGWRLGKDDPIRLRGVILFSPALRPIAKPSAGWLERAFMSLSWASHHHAYLVLARWIIKAFASLSLKQDTSWVKDWVSDIPDERDLQGIDPLILHKAPLGYVASIEQQMFNTIYKGASYPTDAIIFVPRDDHIVNAEGTIAFGGDLCTSRETESSQLIIYEDFWSHELLHSSKREQVLDAVYQWLDVHCR